MSRPACLALATISLLVISSAAAHAQALAPSELHLTSPEQGTKKDTVRAVTKETAPAIAKKPALVNAKEKSPERKTKKETVQAMTKKPIKAITQKAAQAIPEDSARTFAIEPVRPMDQQSTRTPTRSAFHFSFKTPEGKKESAPIITRYYPKQIVYPFAKIDRHIDGKLMQAATIAQERAHAHSRSMCWHYVKEALLASGVIDERSVRRASWVGARLRREPCRRSRRDPHPGRFCQRLQFKNAIAPSFARRLREVVIFPPAAQIRAASSTAPVSNS